MKNQLGTYPNFGSAIVVPKSHVERVCPTVTASAGCGLERPKGYYIAEVDSESVYYRRSSTPTPSKYLKG